MKIALVGGTGDIGNGFATRWACKHEIIIGSRKAEKAKDSAEKLGDMLKERDISASITGTDNASAIEAGDAVVLCVPYGTLGSVTSDLKDCYSDQLVISPVVPMSWGKYFELTPPEQGSAAILIRDLLPDTVRVVSAFHTIPAAALQDPDRSLKGDVVVCGDDGEDKAKVADLTREIKALRPLDAGPLSVSRLVEGLTPLLLNIARINKMRDLGINFVRER